MDKKVKNEKPSTLHEAGLESFVTREIHRGSLNNASYNPRFISDKEREKLKKALKKHGLVAPVTWNERTGNIVGGHQRISIMDALMKTSDYSLTVAVIDVDVAREKELNVLLNNTNAMGSFDLNGLKSLFQDADVTLDGSGMDHKDMIDMFGTEVFNHGRDEDLAALAEKLASLSGQYSAVQERNKKKAQSEFYLVLVFPDGEHIDAMVEHMGLENTRYQSGTVFMDAIGIKKPDQS